MIELGKMNHLKVVRKTDLGYMLSDGKEEILLHYKQALKELEINEEVEAYAYTDKADRKTGTMKTPHLLMNQPDFVSVVNVLEDVGVFVDNGTPKDLLISKDYLPYDKNQWPQVSDELLCELKLKKNSLVAKPLNRFEIHSLYRGMKYSELEKVWASVISIVEKGIGLVTADYVYIFVPNTQLRGMYHLGQKVEVTITKMLEDEAYGTLNQHKEVLIDSDRELIIAYLKAHQGVMKLTAKSSSEEVEKTLKMSRKAFKRAYGGLYKDQIIRFDDEKTYLL